jgi:hypothetical protein
MTAKRTLVEQGAYEGLLGDVRQVISEARFLHGIVTRRNLQRVMEKLAVPFYSKERAVQMHAFWCR